LCRPRKSELARSGRSLDLDASNLAGATLQQGVDLDAVLVAEVMESDRALLPARSR
jgi:hypothetical protein